MLADSRPTTLTNGSSGVKLHKLAQGRSLDRLLRRAATEGEALSDEEPSVTLGMVSYHTEGAGRRRSTPCRVDSLRERGGPVGQARRLRPGYVPRT